MAAVTLRRGKIRKSTLKAAGYDLFSTVNCLIPIGGVVSVDTGTSFLLKDDVVGIIKDRSGLAKKQSITTLAGVIDSDYPVDSNVEVVIHNAGKYPFVINAGDRIAQILFVYRLDAVAGKDGTIEYGDSQRIGGFGSTGV